MENEILDLAKRLHGAFNRESGRFENAVLFGDWDEISDDLRSAWIGVAEEALTVHCPDCAAELRVQLPKVTFHKYNS